MHSSRMCTVRCSDSRGGGCQGGCVPKWGGGCVSRGVMCPGGCVRGCVSRGCVSIRRGCVHWEGVCANWEGAVSRGGGCVQGEGCVSRGVCPEEGFRGTVKILISSGILTRWSLDNIPFARIFCEVKYLKNEDNCWCLFRFDWFILAFMQSTIFITIHRKVCWSPRHRVN